MSILRKCILLLFLFPFSCSDQALDSTNTHGKLHKVLALVLFLIWNYTLVCCNMGTKSDLGEPFSLLLPPSRFEAEPESLVDELVTIQASR